MNTMMNPPDTLSGVLTLAIDTMRNLDRGTYQADSIRWHSPEDDGKCYVCLAGAVMTLRHEPSEHLNWWAAKEYAPTGWSKCFLALEPLRGGRVRHAALHIGVDPRLIPERLRAAVIYNYDFKGWEEADSFLREMEWLRNELKREGL